MHRLVVLAALCLSPLLGQQEPAFNAAAVERGRIQFKSSCGFCHGDDATGNNAPDLVRSPLVSHDVNGDLVGPVIRNGRPEKEMPAFTTLTANQIADMVVFLHHSIYVALHSTQIPRDYPLAKLLTGNAAAGKTYFNGSGGCAGCHSPTADLAHIAGKYSPLDLQQRLLYPAGRIKVTAVVTLPNGQKMEGVVTHDDEFDIAITDKDGWYHSWPHSTVKVEVHDPLAAHRALMEKYTDADIHNLFAYLVTLK